MVVASLSSDVGIEPVLPLCNGHRSTSDLRSVWPNHLGSLLGTTSSFAPRLVYPFKLHALMYWQARIQDFVWGGGDGGVIFVIYGNNLRLNVKNSYKLDPPCNQLIEAPFNFCRWSNFEWIYFIFHSSMETMKTYFHTSAAAGNGDHTLICI